MGEAAFCVAARVIAAQPNGTYVAELANGHRLTAFVAGRERRMFAGLQAGELVKLQLTPYDLSVGRILVETKNFKHESPSVGKEIV